MAYRRKRAYALFHSSCEVLEDIGKAFCSARTVAKLATDTMQEVERVAAGRSKARQLHKSAATGQTACPQYDTVNNGHSFPSASPTTLRQDQTILGSLSGPQPLEARSAQPGMADNALIQNESPSIFDDSIGDAGIFNDFDPNFDLDRIDQVFSANLDPTQPPPAQGWAAGFQFG